MEASTGKSIGDTGKGIKKNDIYDINLLYNENK